MKIMNFELFRSHFERYLWELLLSHSFSTAAVSLNIGVDVSLLLLILKTFLIM